MSFFRQRRPRAFHHNYMYTDIRMEQFKDMERRVRGNRSEVPSGEDGHKLLRGAFSSSASHLRNSRRQQLFLPGICFMTVFVLLVLFVCKILSAL